MPIFKSAVTFCVLLLLTLVLHGSVIAQSEESKFEVGAQFSVIGREASGVATSIGGGGRVTFNLTKYLALEGELNYFPSAGFNNARSFQGQFGVKSGLRFDRFGVFGKVRPGFIDTKYDFRTFCIPFPCPPGSTCLASPCFPASFTVANTDLSLDVGGVLEFYPSKLVTVRFDVGDTVVNRSFATHNLQIGAGVGFRF
jgi:outer membrane protein with beta-barrel domain